MRNESLEVIRIALNGWTISKSKIGKDVGESGHGPSSGTTLAFSPRQCGKPAS
jgi:hypothetical protein